MAIGRVQTIWHVAGITDPVRIVFDRGTLVFHDVPDGVDVARIPGVLWDARIGAHRAPARLAYALASEFRRRGVPLADAPRPRLGFA